MNNKALEQKLAENEKLLSTIIQTLPVAVFCKDIRKNFQWSLWNKKAEELFGIKAQDCLGKYDQDLFSQEQAKESRTKDLEAIQTQGILDIPEERVQNGPEDLFVHTQKLVIRDTAGNPLILLGISEDITARKQAEAERLRYHQRESEYHQKHIEFSQMVQTDIKSTLQYILRQTAHTLGIERVSYWSFEANQQAIVCQQLYEKTLDRLSEDPVRIEANQVPAYFQALSKFQSILAEDAQSDPRTAEFTESYFKPLGITSLFDVYVWFHGKVMGVLCHEHVGLPFRKWDRLDYELALAASQQITWALEAYARYQAESELAESEQMLANIIQYLPHAVFCKNIKRNYQFSMWNEKAEEIFGLTAKEVLGKTDYDFFPTEEADGFRAKDIEASQAIGIIHIAEETVHGKQGIVTVQTKKIVVRNAKREPHFLLGISEDISQRLHSERILESAMFEAKAANQAKDRFLAVMSHEIRTPLNGVLGMLQIIQLTPLQIDQQEMVDVAQRSGEALLALLNDLLDFSKIEADQLILDTHNFSLHRLLQDTVTLLSPACHGKGLSLISQMQKGVPDQILGDSTRLRQIFTNLLFNAIKFTEQGEVKLEVELEAENPDGTKLLKFSVYDTGIGIPAELKDVIFDPFVQADSSITRKYGGTGLGLPICQRLVSAMGGNLEVMPRPEGGSLFFFSLCFSEVAEKYTQISEEKLHFENYKARILVVEDNIVNQMVAVAMLKKLGLQADVVSDGEQGLLALENQAYDLVLMDMMMPVMDGLNATRNLRLRESENEHIPVIAMTANASKSDCDVCLAAGMDDFLSKPIGIAGMRLMLSRWLKEPVTVTATVEKPVEMAKVRILLVEDNIVNQMVVVGMLKKLGVEADVAGDGEQGLLAVAQQAYDLVLMDVMMPVMDGLEATRNLRQRETKEKRLPVIALTANVSESDRQACLAAGMDDFLPKPIGIDGMRAVLARWLNGSPSTEKSPAKPSLLRTDSDVLNPAVMSELKDFLQTDFSRTMRMFLQNTQELITTLQDAGTRRDRNLLMRQAHALKGSSSNVGALNLSALCATLEKDALTLEWEVLEGFVLNLTKAYSFVKSALETDWI